ncbi:pheophorbide a oxygenase [Leptolyngbya sp. NIES-3755]|nr:pheophorbide a oxygenase [Leptolyngbya sp. NIES-3755]
MLIDQRPLSTEATELPAGGTDPTRFDWKEAWYPVYYIQDLDKTKPTKFTLLGQDLVIWWDAKAQSWRAFEDQCPHRLAPLSEGRIAEDGLLECPYHGWAFEGNGKCDRIPQQPEGAIANESKRACVKSYATAERQGLLFVYPGEQTPEQVKIPIVEPMEESPQEWVCLNTFRDLPYDALTLLENVLDTSHLPFTHHKSVGNRSNAAPVELEVLESGKQGFTGFWQEGPRKGTLGSQQTRFIAPGLMWHDLTSKQFGRTLTVVYATPIRKGECRVFARFPFKFSSKLPSFFIKLTPRWYSHLGNNTVLEDDQIFLHYQERYLDQKGGSPNFAKAFYLPTRADSFVSGLRKWVNEFDAEPFPGEELPRLRSIDELLDRYSSHTIHCASCRTALARIQKLKFAIAILGILTWATLPLISIVFQPSSLTLAILAAIVPLISGSIWLVLHGFERKFYKGERTPARNLPGK